MISTKQVLAWAAFLTTLSLSAGCIGFGLAALSDRLGGILPAPAAKTPNGAIRPVALSISTAVLTNTATLAPTPIPPTSTPAGKTPLPVTLAPPAPAYLADYEVIADCRGYAFVSDGITVGDGATTMTFLTSIFLDPKWGCAPNEDAVDCMLRQRNPRLVIVALGKNPDPDFGKNLPLILAKLGGRAYLLIGRHTRDEEADAIVNAIMAKRGHFIDFKAEAISRGFLVYNGSQKVYDVVLHPQGDGFHYSECGFQLLRDLVFHTGTPACHAYVP